MCDGNSNIEHLYILPSRWLYLLQFEEFSDNIYEIFQNASCTPIKFFVEENFDSWHPKTKHKTYTVPVGQYTLHISVYEPKFLDMCHNALICLG